MENFETETKKKVLEWRSQINSTFAHISNYFEDSNITYYKYKELSYFDGEIFVINAYKAIFKRHPDDAGLKHYTHKLLQEKSKTKLILELLSSDEGKLQNVKIRGAHFAHFLETMRDFLVPNSLKKTTPKLSYFSRINDQCRELTETVAELKIQLLEVGEQLRQSQSVTETLLSRINQQETELNNITEDLGINLKEHIPNWEHFYLTLENKFRGPRQEIKQRLNYYLPHLQAIKSQDDIPVLDIGPGRGEWLELLKENEIPAIGIDINQSMVEECLQLNLNVSLEDALNYLRSQPSNSFRAITGFHIIEHLPFITLMNLVDEAHRTLQDGGALIFETPNPLNVMVATWTFYLDPTHRKPLPPLLMEHIFNNKGFKKSHIIELNEIDHSNNTTDPVNIKIEAIINGPRDYAIIGYK